MNINLIEELKKKKFDKQLKKLEKKIGKKSIAIYGTGILFEIINKNYNLSKLNVIALSDRKVTTEGEFLGYKTIPLKEIAALSPDYVLVSILNPLEIIEDLEINEFKNTKIKVRELVKSPFFKILKEIWLG